MLHITKYVCLYIAQYICKPSSYLSFCPDQTQDMDASGPYSAKLVNFGRGFSGLREAKHCAPETETPARPYDPQPNRPELLVSFDALRSIKENRLPQLPKGPRNNKATLFRTLPSLKMDQLRETERSKGRFAAGKYASTLVSSFQSGPLALANARARAPPASCSGMGCF